MITKELRISGSACGSVQETLEALEFAAKNGVKVHAEKFSFEDFPKALDRLENGRPQFRCVVNVKDYAEKYFPEK